MPLKQLIWIADSHRVLAEFPEAVQRHVGFALYQAQMGARHVDAKPLKNIAGGVLESSPITAATLFVPSTP